MRELARLRRWTDRAEKIVDARRRRDEVDELRAVRWPRKTRDGLIALREIGDRAGRRVEASQEWCGPSFA